MVINKKILRTLRADKTRYLGLLLLVIFSCLSFTSLQLIAPSALGSLHGFWQEANLEDAHFTLHQPLEDIDGLERKLSLQIEEVRHHDNTVGNVTLRVFQETKKINRHGVVAGRDLQGPGEILVDRIYANNNKLTIGSSISVGDRLFEVVGLVTKPDYIYTLKNHTDLLPGTFGIGVIARGDFAKLPQSQLTYSVVFSQSNQEELRSYLNENNTILGWLDREDNPRIVAVEPDLQVKETVGNFVPTFVLIVTCTIIAVILWRLLKTEFVQIGTLYALGYKKSDILKHYMVYPLILSAVGGVVGTLLGIWLAIPMLMVTDGLQYNLPVIQLAQRPIILIISLMLPSLFLLPTTWYVVRKALKLSPLELMRGAGSNTKVGWLERSLSLNRFGFNTKFRIREVVRNVPRAIALIMGITFASSLLMIGFVMNDSIKEVVEVGYDKLYKYDYQYVLKGLRFDDPNGAERQAMIPAGVRTDGEEILVSVFGVEPRGMLLNITNTRGDRISDKVSVTRPLADTLNLQPGDTISIQSRVSTFQTELVIEEIADTYVGFFLFLPLDEFNYTFGMPEGSYTILLSDRALLLDSEMVGSVITSEELREGFGAMMNMLQGFIIVLGLISVIIGVIIIYILTSLLIEENRYNISLMKVLGYGKGQIFSLILNTNLLLVLLGFALSVPFIRYISEIMFEEVTEEMSMAIPAVINNYSILLGLVIILIAFWLSNLASRRKVWEISMADSLKSRED